MLYLRMYLNYEKCIEEGKKEMERCDVLEIGIVNVEIQMLRGAAEPQKVERGRVLRDKRRGEARRVSPQNNGRLRNRWYGC